VLAYGLGSQEFVQIRTGEFHMPHIPLGISAIAALFIATAIVPSEGMAFDLENAAATVPGGTQFQDPDENLLVAPGSLPLVKDDTSDSSNFQPSGSTLQLTPGTTLSITGGTGPALGLQSGAPMGPVIDRSNPADNRSLIPSP
jgi:hypothetical protein